MNKNLITYSIIFFILISLFGFNFFLSIIGNLLLLIFLVPLLILSVLLISFNSLKSKVNTCDQCGTITLGMNNTCMNCGADLENKNSKRSESLKKPSETTIEVKAEEIK
tara:strand:+ start:290 stop:616 length:327 start_codon:yes stop_codon:yes gene_type:complete